MTDDTTDDLAQAIGKIEQLVAHGRRGCLTLRTL